MKKYNVDINANYIVQRDTTISIKAHSENEAKIKALEYVKEHHNDCDWGMHEQDDKTCYTIEKVKVDRPLKTFKVIRAVELKAFVDQVLEFKAHDIEHAIQMIRECQKSQGDIASEYYQEVYPWDDCPRNTVPTGKYQWQDKHILNIECID